MVGVSRLRGLVAPSFLLAALWVANGSKGLMAAALRGVGPAFLQSYAFVFLIAGFLVLRMPKQL